MGLNLFTVTVSDDEVRNVTYNSLALVLGFINSLAKTKPTQHQATYALALLIALRETFPDAISELLGELNVQGGWEEYGRERN